MLPAEDADRVFGKAAKILGNGIHVIAAILGVNSESKILGERLKSLDWAFGRVICDE